MKQYLRQVIIEPGGWLMLSVLYFFADVDEFLIVIACVLIHEWGHLSVLRRFHVPIRQISVGMTGFTIKYSDYYLYGIRECIAALSGPIFGLAAAGIGAFLGNVFGFERLYLFAGCNAILSLFNLLPAKPLDGWRCLHALFPSLAQGLSFFTAVGVLAAGLAVMYAGYGTAPAIMGIALLLQDESCNLPIIGAY